MTPFEALAQIADGTVPNPQSFAAKTIAQLDRPDTGVSYVVTLPGLPDWEADRWLDDALKLGFGAEGYTATRLT